VSGGGPSMPAAIAVSAGVRQRLKFIASERRDRRHPLSKRAPYAMNDGSVAPEERGRRRSTRRVAFVVAPGLELRPRCPCSQLHGSPGLWDLPTLAIAGESKEAGCGALRLSGFGYHRRPIITRLECSGGRRASARVRSPGITVWRDMGPAQGRSLCVASAASR
jgi:hypothetical protein